MSIPASLFQSRSSARWVPERSPRDMKAACLSLIARNAFATSFALDAGRVTLRPNEHEVVVHYGKSFDAFAFGDKLQFRYFGMHEYDIGLATPERAIEAAESAVEAGRDEIRLEAGVFDPHKFDQLAAPVEQKVSAPWLRKRNDKINVVDLERREERPATPAEIETGVYAEEF
jgi:hypothetical protein